MNLLAKYYQLILLDNIHKHYYLERGYKSWMLITKYIWYITQWSAQLIDGVWVCFLGPSRVRYFTSNGSWVFTYEKKIFSTSMNNYSRRLFGYTAYPYYWESVILQKLYINFELFSLQVSRLLRNQWKDNPWSPAVWYTKIYYTIISFLPHFYAHNGDRDEIGKLLKKKKKHKTVPISPSL